MIKKIIIGVIIALSIICLAFGLVIIPATDNGVVTRFGKYNRTLKPGLYFVMPFAEWVYKVPVTIIQKEEFGFRTLQSNRTSNQYQNNLNEESFMLTGDLNIVNVEWVVQYRIIDPRAWIFNVEESVRIPTIRDISRAVINRLVGNRPILAVMGSDRNNIQELSKQLMNESYAQTGLGISVTSVQLQNIIPPPQVQEAFEDVNVAIQDMNRLINEGKEAYNKAIPKAKGDADKMIEEAWGYATERVNKAKGDVARFNAVYAQYQKAPNITKRRLYLETLQKVFADPDSVIFIDKNLKNFLPLSNIDALKKHESAQ